MKEPRWPILRGWDNDPTSPMYETEARYRARVDAHIAEVKLVSEARGYRLNPETGLYEHPTIKVVKA